MPFVRRAVLLVALAFALFATPSTARAVCGGDCGTDLATVPKTVEKFVKARWKAVLKCGKKASPACPTACPVPDGSADPYFALRELLGADRLQPRCARREPPTTRPGTTSASARAAAATACGNVRAATAGKLVSTKLTRRRTNKMNTFPKDVAKCAAKIAKVPSCDPGICNDATDWIDGIFPLAISPTGHQSLPFNGRGTR